MSLPEPYPGLVISYAYLWWEEFRQGREEGRKDRPCAVVVARRIEADQTVVTVVPITHSPPDDSVTAIEIPAATKARLGLDAERSWVVLDETNDFLWPGPDLRPRAGGHGADIAYGPLPPRFFRQLRNQLLAVYETGRLRRVQRTQ